MLSAIEGCSDPSAFFKGRQRTLVSNRAAWRDPLEPKRRGEMEAAMGRIVKSSANADLGHIRAT
jgi:hypothetical protein